MQDTHSPNQDNKAISNNRPNIRRVNAKQGAVWLTHAYQLFYLSIGSWLGISAFLIFVLSIPGINSIISIFMPVAIGGIMLGCQQLSKQSPLKFDHLFEGLKSDTKPLLHLSIIYALCSLAIVVVTYYLMLLLDVDVIELSAQLTNKEIIQMTKTEKIEWFNDLIQNGTLVYLLLAFLILLALMLPLFMAFWFAPALVVFKKTTAIDSLKLSFIACKSNMLPFFVYGLAIFGYFILFFILLVVIIATIPLMAILLTLAGYITAFAITLASIYTSYVDIFEQDTHFIDKHNGQDDTGSSMLA